MPSEVFAEHRLENFGSDEFFHYTREITGGDSRKFAIPHL